MRPKNYAPAKAGIIYCHGAEGEAGGGLTWMKVPERIPMLRQLAGAGYTMVSADMGGVATWGNATAIARISSARTYIQTLAGVSAGKVVLVGQSMGALNALNWARANPTLVHCVIALIPVINLTDVRDNHGLSASIDSAYAGGYSQATYGAAHNPATFAAAGGLAGIPIQCWYGTTDTLCLPAFATAFGAAANACVLKPVAGGHAEATIALMDPAQVLSFVLSNS
jgi:S-formylglutathione hydrolase FrmB